MNRVQAGSGHSVGFFRTILPWAVVLLTVGGVALFHDRIFHGGKLAAANHPGDTPAPSTAPASAHDPLTHVNLPEGKFKAAGINEVEARTVELPSEVAVAGQIVPNVDRRVEIRPRIVGVVRTVNAALGQVVKKGDVLAVLDSPDVGTARLNLRARQRELATARIDADWKREVSRNVEAMIPLLKKGVAGKEIERDFAGKSLGSFKANLLSTYAELEIATHEEEKQKDLFNKQIVGEHPVFVAVHTREGSQAKFDGLLEQARFDATQQTRVAEQEVRNAEAAVIDAAQRLRILGVDEDIRALLARPRPENSQSAMALPYDADEDVTAYSILAPIDGTIIAKTVVPSQRTDPTDGLYVLADLSTVRVSANLSESRLHLLPTLKDAKVQFTATAYPGKTFEAKVLSIGSQVDTTTRTVSLLAELPNPDGLLKLGMFTRIILGGKTTESALVVPTGSVIDIDGKTAVFQSVADSKSPDEHVYRFHPVTVGRESGGFRTIVSGLKPGDRVVNTGAFLLKSELILQNETEEE